MYSDSPVACIYYLEEYCSVIRANTITPSLQQPQDALLLTTHSQMFFLCTNTINIQIGIVFLGVTNC